MSDQLDEMVDNIREPSAWIRGLFVVAFIVGLNVIILPIILVLSIVQILFSLCTGESNANLRYFAGTLELYISQIIRFLTYNSERKPFPFSDLPELDVETVENGKQQSESNMKENANTPNKNNGANKAVNTDEESDSTIEDTTAEISANKKSSASKPATKKKAAKKSSVKKAAQKKKSAIKSENKNKR